LTLSVAVAAAGGTFNLSTALEAWTFVGHMNSKFAFFCASICK